MASCRLSAPFLAACATVVLATACGIPGPSSGCLVSSCIASSPTATARGWTTTASVSSGKILVRVTVVGPLSVEAGCSPALTAWVVRRDGTKIEPSPDTGVRCHAIVIDDIAAGQTRDYSTVIPAPTPGTYTVHGLVRVHLPVGAGARASENIAVATLQVS